jgi:hypothetical protein
VIWHLTLDLSVVQKVEEELKDVKESSADCILDYLKYLQSLE